VVAHVPLERGPAVQFFVGEGLRDRILLYIVHESGRAISVADITEPAHGLIYLVYDEGLWVVRHVEPIDWKTKAWWDFATAP
jgi:hypothetical protein